jgi:hypothetical protein
MSECVGGLRPFRLAGCLILLAVAAPFLSAQNVINVPADQPTIQTAINAANNGDTVLVTPGKYVENINFGGKAITVTSSGGPSVTTIDGGAKGSVVTFNSSETASAKLNGFTITDGLQNGYWGGGIFISGASPTITGNVITGNHAAVGIGIYVNGGSPLIQNNTITGNDQKGAGDGGEGGGGILVSGSNTITTAPQIIGNTITNNSVGLGGNGGGISLTYFSSPLVQNNLIQGNTAWNGGGGISVQSYNSPTIVQNVIVNNSSLGGGSGGGVYVSPSSSSQTQIFLNNTIAGNTAVDNTSGVFVYGFGQFSTFTNNIIVAATGQVAVTCNSTYSSISPVFSYNDAFSSSGQNWAGICDTTSQPENISADPLFLSAADFHIQWGSPAVDAGNNSAPNLSTTDFDGNPRVVDGNGDGIAVVDLGAYEVSPTTITLVSNSLTFGPQPLGTTSASQTVTLTNTGNQKLLFAMSVSANFAETDNCGSSLAAGASCSINVSFSPAVTGNITGNVSLKDTASGSPHTVALAGTGGAPVASLNPTSLNFGAQPVGTTSATQTITLSNTGNDAMAISSITSSGDFAETNACGATLAAGANCSISVTFTPATTGSRPGLITITDNASGSPQNVSLTGTGTAPSATLSPASLAFGGQFVGTKSAAQTTTLSNTGNAPLTISAITSTGNFAETNTCGTTLAAGASCSINVTFTPTAVGTRSGSVTVADNASGSPHSVSLTGTGTAPMATLSPTSLIFGSQVIGTTSPAQSATLSNTGTAPLTISAITITGDFAQTNNCGTTLAAATSCTISVTFTPSVTGARTGSLTVSSNSQGGAVSAALSGSGVENAPTFSPTSLAFSSQVVGTKSGGQNIKLTANGPGPLVISSIAVTGQFLESTNCPASLNTGSSCNITINFLPTVGGPATGSVVVTDNGLGSPQAVPLSGNGLDFTLSASPSSVTINAGYNAQYTVTATEVGGSFNNSVNLTCSGLPAQSQCQFSPGGISPKTGSASATLTIQTKKGGNGTPSGSYVITIAGTSGSLKHTTTVNLTVN